jgi:hypothetical protein
MTRELEKQIAQKIYKYQFINRDESGIINNQANELIREFTDYTLKVPIKSFDNIPSKFDPIIKG